MNKMDILIQDPKILTLLINKISQGQIKTQSKQMIIQK